MSVSHVSLTDSLEAYLARMHSHAADPAWPAIRADTVALGDRARMQIGPEQGALLSLLVGITGARNVIEIGTFTGYSALCLARALPPGGHLWCCDVSAEWTSIARRHWEKSGVADRVTLPHGPAAETLAALDSNLRFDLAFIDADKTGYDAYFELLLPRMRPSALFVFDNMLQGGDIEDAADPNAAALDRLNRKLAADSRVESVLLPVADGLMLARVR